MIKLLQIVVLSTISIHSYSQVFERPINFDKEGYVYDMALKKRSLNVHFVTKDEIYSDTVQLSDSCKYELESKISNFSGVKISMRAKFIGNYYPNSRRTIINSVKEIPINRSIKIEMGRMDSLSSDIAYIDGQMVKLENGVICKGVEKDNSEGQTANSFKELMNGQIITKLEGTYKEDGILYAKKVEFKGDLKTEFDEYATTNSGYYKNKLTEQWKNPIKRKSILGTEVIPGIFAFPDDKVQAAVTKVANRLIPKYIKDKIDFIFIVTTDENWNACVYPDGLGLVNIGLLKTMDNEDQLAAVLGHEIAHAIYEHTALSIEKDRSVLKRFKTIEGISDVIDRVSGGLSKINPWKKEVPVVKSETSKLLFEQLPKAEALKNLADYNVSQESQADRIGLYYMVAAGYDPREATIVWANAFNSNPPEDPLVSKSQLKENINGREGKKSSSKYFINDLIKKEVSKSIKTKLLEAKKTHPDNITRFRKLHELVYMYWNRKINIK